MDVRTVILTHAVVAETHVVERNVVLPNVLRAVAVEFESVSVLSNAVVEPPDLKRDVLAREIESASRGNRTCGGGGVRKTCQHRF